MEPSFLQAIQKFKREDGFHLMETAINQSLAGSAVSSIEGVGEALGTWLEQPDQLDDLEYFWSLTHDRGPPSALAVEPWTLTEVSDKDDTRIFTEIHISDRSAGCLLSVPIAFHNRSGSDEPSNFRIYFAEDGVDDFEGGIDKLHIWGWSSRVPTCTDWMEDAYVHDEQCIASKYTKFRI